MHGLQPDTYTLIRAARGARKDDAMNDPTNRPPSSDAAHDDLMREQRLQRNLKILVIGLGLLILVGFGALIMKTMGIAAGSKPVAGSPAIAIRAASGAAANYTVELPRGARIVSVSLSGTRLAVIHESAYGTGIAIIDLDTGKRIADVKPVEAVPRD